MADHNRMASAPSVDVKRDGVDGDANGVYDYEKERHVSGTPSCPESRESNFLSSVDDFCNKDMVNDSIVGDVDFCTDDSGKGIKLKESSDPECSEGMLGNNDLDRIAAGCDNIDMTLCHAPESKEAMLGGKNGADDTTVHCEDVPMLGDQMPASMVPVVGNYDDSDCVDVDETTTSRENVSLAPGITSISIVSGHSQSSGESYVDVSANDALGSASDEISNVDLHCVTDIQNSGAQDILPRIEDGVIIDANNGTNSARSCHPTLVNSANICINGTSESSAISSQFSDARWATSSKKVRNGVPATTQSYTSSSGNFMMCSNGRSASWPAFPSCYTSINGDSNGSATRCSVVPVGPGAVGNSHSNGNEECVVSVKNFGNGKDIESVGEEVSKRIGVVLMSEEDKSEFTSFQDEISEQRNGFHVPGECSVIKSGLDNVSDGSLCTNGMDRCGDDNGFGEVNGDSGSVVKPLEIRGFPDLPIDVPEMCVLLEIDCAGVELGEVKEDEGRSRKKVRSSSRSKPRRQGAPRGLGVRSKETDREHTSPPAERSTSRDLANSKDGKVRGAGRRKGVAVKECGDSSALVDSGCDSYGGGSGPGGVMKTLVDSEPFIDKNLNGVAGGKTDTSVHCNEKENCEYPSMSTETPSSHNGARSKNYDLKGAKHRKGVAVKRRVDGCGSRGDVASKDAQHKDPVAMKESGDDSSEVKPGGGDDDGFSQEVVVSDVVSSEPVKSNKSSDEVSDDDISDWELVAKEDFLKESCETQDKTTRPKINMSLFVFNLFSSILNNNRNTMDEEFVDCDCPGACNCSTLYRSYGMPPIKNSHSFVNMGTETLSSVRTDLQPSTPPGIETDDEIEIIASGLTDLMMENATDISTDSETMLNAIENEHESQNGIGFTQADYRRTKQDNPSDSFAISIHDSLPMISDTTTNANGSTSQISTNDTTPTAKDSSPPISTHRTMPVSNYCLLSTYSSDATPAANDSNSHFSTLTANAAVPTSTADSMPFTYDDCLPYSSTDTMPTTNSNTLRIPTLVENASDTMINMNDSTFQSSGPLPEFTNDSTLNANDSSSPNTDDVSLQMSTNNSLPVANESSLTTSTSTSDATPIANNGILQISTFTANGFSTPNSTTDAMTNSKDDLPISTNYDFIQSAYKNTLPNSTNDAVAIDIDECVPSFTADNVPFANHGSLPDSTKNSMLNTNEKSLSNSTNGTMPNTNDSLPNSTNDTKTVENEECLPNSTNDTKTVEIEECLPNSSNDTKTVENEECLPNSSNDTKTVENEECLPNSTNDTKTVENEECLPKSTNDTKTVENEECLPNSTNDTKTVENEDCLPNSTIDTVPIANGYLPDLTTDTMNIKNGGSMPDSTNNTLPIANDGYSSKDIVNRANSTDDSSLNAKLTSLPNSNGEIISLQNSAKDALPNAKHVPSPTITNRTLTCAGNAPSSNNTHVTSTNPIYASSPNTKNVTMTNTNDISKPDINNGTITNANNKHVPKSKSPLLAKVLKFKNVLSSSVRKIKSALNTPVPRQNGSKSQEVHRPNGSDHPPVSKSDSFSYSKTTSGHVSYPLKVGSTSSPDYSFSSPSTPSLTTLPKTPNHAENVSSTTSRRVENQHAAQQPSPPSRDAHLTQAPSSGRAMFKQSSQSSASSHTVAGHKQPKTHKSASTNRPIDDICAQSRLVPVEGLQSLHSSTPPISISSMARSQPQRISHPRRRHYHQQKRSDLDDQDPVSYGRKPRAESFISSFVERNEGDFIRAVEEFHSYAGAGEKDKVAEERDTFYVNREVSDGRNGKVVNVSDRRGHDYRGGDVAAGDSLGKSQGDSNSKKNGVCVEEEVEESERKKKDDECTDNEIHEGIDYDESCEDNSPNVNLTQLNVKVDDLNKQSEAKEESEDGKEEKETERTNKEELVCPVNEISEDVQGDCLNDNQPSIVAQLQLALERARTIHCNSTTKCPSDKEDDVPQSKKQTEVNEDNGIMCMLNRALLMRDRELQNDAVEPSANENEESCKSEKDRDYLDVKEAGGAELRVSKEERNKMKNKRRNRRRKMQKAKGKEEDMLDEVVRAFDGVCNGGGDEKEAGGDVQRKIMVRDVKDEQIENRKERKKSRKKRNRAKRKEEEETENLDEVEQSLDGVCNDGGDDEEDADGQNGLKGRDAKERKNKHKKERKKRQKAKRKEEKKKASVTFAIDSDDEEEEDGDRMNKHCDDDRNNEKNDDDDEDENTSNNEKDDDNNDGSNEDDYDDSNNEEEYHDIDDNDDDGNYEEEEDADDDKKDVKDGDENQSSSSEIKFSYVRESEVVPRGVDNSFIRGLHIYTYQYKNRVIPKGCRRRIHIHHCCGSPTECRGKNLCCGREIPENCRFVRPKNAPALKPEEIYEDAVREGRARRALQSAYFDSDGERRNRRGAVKQQPSSNDASCDKEKNHEVIEQCDAVSSDSSTLCDSSRIEHGATKGNGDDAEAVLPSSCETVVAAAEEAGPPAISERTGDASGNITAAVELSSTTSENDRSRETSVRPLASDNVAREPMLKHLLDVRVRQDSKDSGVSSSSGGRRSTEGTSSCDASGKVNPLSDAMRVGAGVDFVTVGNVSSEPGASVVVSSTEIGETGETSRGSQRREEEARDEAGDMRDEKKKRRRLGKKQRRKMRQKEKDEDGKEEEEK